jgi:hypothetical protein
MAIDKTLFAQVMDYVPLKIIENMIDRHCVVAGMRALNCAGLFAVDMALVFARH